MRVYYREYYTRFRCLASRCPDSCCQEWDIQVDAASAARYRVLPGALGDRLRRSLAEDPACGTVLTLEDGRCPMWRSDGLCAIQSALGEAALCKTCREFPRLTHDYGDFVEHGLELSCPEAARLILGAPAAPMLADQCPGEEPPAYDSDAMTLLRSSRGSALTLLDGHLPPARALGLTLVYAHRVQKALDGGQKPALPRKLPAFDPTGGSMESIYRLFRSLDIMTERWRSLLALPRPPRLSPALLPLMRYFVERYWLQAVSDYDLLGRVKFSVVSCLLIGSMGEALPQNAQLFSKEVENSPENMDALLDAMYDDPAFSTDRLLGLLRKL